MNVTESINTYHSFSVFSFLFLICRLCSLVLLSLAILVADMWKFLIFVISELFKAAVRNPLSVLGLGLNIYLSLYNLNCSRLDYGYGDVGGTTPPTPNATTLAPVTSTVAPETTVIPITVVPPMPDDVCRMSLGLELASVIPILIYTYMFLDRYYVISFSALISGAFCFTLLLIQLGAQQVLFGYHSILIPVLLVCRITVAIYRRELMYEEVFVGSKIQDGYSPDPLSTSYTTQYESVESVVDVHSSWICLVPLSRSVV